MSDYSTEGRELIPPKKNALLQISLKLGSPNRSLHFSDHQVTANLVKNKKQVNASWYFSQESHNGLLSYPILNSSLNRKHPENAYIGVATKMLARSSYLEKLPSFPSTFIAL